MSFPFETLKRLTKSVKNTCLDDNGIFFLIPRPFECHIPMYDSPDSV